MKGTATKWERTFQDEDETIIWRYDLSKNKSGPYEVEIKSKVPVKNLPPIQRNTRKKKTT